MKFDLTVKDVSADEVRKILDVASGSVAPAQPVTATPLLTPSTAVAAQEDESAESSADVSGQIDAEGLPWDARIHSGNKKKKADGTWTRKRGCSDVEFEAVKAELLRSSVAPFPAFTPPPVPEQFAGVSPVPTPVPAFTPPPAPMPVIANTMNTVLTRIQQGFAAGRMDANYIPSLQTRLGQHFGVQINAITDIAGRQDIIDAAIALMDQDGK